MTRHAGGSKNSWFDGTDVPPPPIPDDDPLSQSADPRYAGLPPELRPRTECLKDVMARMLPYWYEAVVPDLGLGLTGYPRAGFRTSRIVQ